MRSSRGPLSRGQGRHVVPPKSRADGTPDAGQGQRRESEFDKDIDHDRAMGHIASVSRNSGLEKGGDLLKGATVQEEFRGFIDRKLRNFWDSRGTRASNKFPVDSSVQNLKDKQENILILFRKLREGLFASGRTDDFALEVYETSLYLSVIFDSPVQTTSILSRLVPDLHSMVLVPQPFRLTPTTCLISLLHQLIISFPSQQSYLEQIKHLVPNLLEQPSDVYLWISALARNLRTFNFVQFERLSQPNAFEHLLESSRSISSSDVTAESMLRDLPRNAVHVLVFRLRMKARDEAWRVVRNSYRELSSSDETQMWLGKRLFFDNFGSEASVVRFDDWVRERCRDGHLRPKEGLEGRWTVCKAR